jgi:hypothetical protein
VPSGGVGVLLRGLSRNLLVASLLLASGAAIANTTPEASATSASQAYSVLQRLGLLQKPAPAEPARHLEKTAPATPPAPAVSAAASAAEPAPAVNVALAATDPLSRAYELLRAKGLLPGGPAKPHAQADSPRRRPGAERVLVDKSERKLVLFKGGRPYREYRISLGGMPEGPKQRAGDLRTPEGVYTLDWRNPRSRFYKSIHISYPNEQDRTRAAELGVDPGGNIMIHGEHYLPSLKRTLRRAKTPKDWTEGCIAINNESMDEIWHEVADGTPIEIRP